MSDDEEVMQSEEEGSEEEEEAKDEGPSEAQLAMQKRRQQQTVSTSGLDEEAQEMLEQNRQDRDKMEEEINELRERSERRKKEREQEEREMAEAREAEERRRKAEEDERKKKKSDEEDRKKEERAAKMAELNKWKNPQTPNFVISKKSPTSAGGDEDDEEGGVPKKSREQLEAEKTAILKQRIQPCDTAGMDAAKLAEKAREIHGQLFRLESEKYDLERRFKGQMNDMQELAERARSVNKVGKAGSIKRVQLGEEDTDTMQEKFAGCPARIVMYSQFERQMDKRPYDDRKVVFKGPVYGFPAEKVAPCRKVVWDDSTGLPTYEDIPGMVQPEEEE